jgi:hypothetical protein
VPVPAARPGAARSINAPEGERRADCGEPSWSGTPRRLLPRPCLQNGKRLALDCRMRDVSWAHDCLVVFGLPSHKRPLAVVFAFCLGMVTPVSHAPDNRPRARHGPDAADHPSSVKRVCGPSKRQRPDWVSDIKWPDAWTRTTDARSGALRRPRTSYSSGLISSRVVPARINPRRRQRMGSPRKSYLPHARASPIASVPASARLRALIQRTEWRAHL